MNTTFQYKGYQVEIVGDPSAPISIMVDGKDYTLLWDGSDSKWCAATWIKGHLDAELRSRLEFQMRDQQMANAAKGWKPEAVSGSGQTVLSATNKQALIRIAYCCWYIGSPILWLTVTNAFERDLYNVDPYLWREQHASLGYGLICCLLFAAWLFVPLILVRVFKETTKQK